MNVQQKLTVLATIVCVVLLLGGAQVILLSTENDTALAATPAGQLRSSALEEYKTQTRPAKSINPTGEQKVGTGAWIFFITALTPLTW